MLMGKLPTQQLLQQYGMEDLGDVAAAVRQGDVGLMQRTLHSNMYRFIQTGTFFLYERLVQVSAGAPLSQPLAVLPWWDV
jgi:hypothetical protein